MITITKEFKFKDTYGIEKLGDPEKLLFFDIETTGLSSQRDRIYLIGCVYISDGVWYMKQWFADSPESEGELLVHFFMFSSRFSTLIHFNGTTFDLPFIRDRASRLKTPTGRHCPESLDLYRKSRFLKKLLSLPDCRQKTFEDFLGTGRRDPYDGGQLIEIYREYLRTKEESLLKVLLLHNEEDVEGLPALLSLLSYPDFLGGAFSPESEILHPYKTYEGTEEQELLITCRSRTASVPVPFRFCTGLYTFFCERDRLSFRTPLVNGTFKYFFKNYADYFYLPEEDRAIHKSVAIYVEKNHRKKATARTCYQKKTGCFLPVPEKAADDFPIFYESYKKAPAYMEYREGIWKNSDFLQKFLLATLPN